MFNKKLSASKLICIFSFAITLSLAIFLPHNTARAQGTFPGAVQYTVRSGDTLFLIAKNNGISLDILRSVNGIRSDLIYPGQIFNIPANTGKIFTRYTIAPGDTLFLIARKFGITVNSLKYANSISSDMIITGQVLTIPFLQQPSLAAAISSKGADVRTNGMDLVVDKSEHTMLLFSKGTWLKTFHVEIGLGGLGDKQVAGDKKTPEGTYYVCQISVLNPKDQYLGTRWMRLSYPNYAAAARGLSTGLINWNTYNAINSALDKGGIPPQNTALGAGVGIHGGSNPEAGSDWTWGCIGLTCNDVQELFNYVGVGTHVYIQK